jgi:hypothetical protein
LKRQAKVNTACGNESVVKIAFDEISGSHGGEYEDESSGTLLREVW